MSWSFSGFGKARAVAAKAKEDLTRFKCAEPEETIKTKALEIIEASLAGMSDNIVKVEANGSQYVDKGNVVNSFHMNISQVHGFIAE